MALSLLPIRLSYNSGEHDLLSEFYLPCLRAAHRYDRAVGFFSSNVLTKIAEGLFEFLGRDGRVRLVCSPRLTEDDIAAINQGYEVRDTIVEKALLRELEAFRPEAKESHLPLLTWLIANGRLDIKIAIPSRLSYADYGIYHEKLGLFEDEIGDSIAFVGSNNETLHGVSLNYEAFDVYRSWLESERCEEKKRHFSRLWEGMAPGLNVITFPEAVRDRLLELVPPNAEKPRNMGQPSGSTVRARPVFESLWPFQKEAVAAFEDAGGRGILSMATGAGKTKTAVAALQRILHREERLFAVIVAPQNTIINQWEQDIAATGSFQHTVLADGTNSKWADQLADRVYDFNHAAIRSCAILTTYNTLSSAKFIKIISSLTGPSMLVGDEVHWAGADTFAQGLLPMIKFRLGLSATPTRHFDQEGTDVILDYFGPVVYEFPLERALSEINPETGKSFLCPYYYHPVFVELSTEEFEEYIRLSEQIRAQYARERKLSQRTAKFQRLCEQRARIITNAAGKHEALRALLARLRGKRHVLVYCSPEQIDSIQETMTDCGFTHHRFTGEESTKVMAQFGNRTERDFLLQNFEDGTYSALVAMKCLDEGINVLTAETGIILASSTNPKQYIQRRGRLLRRCPGKEHVSIYDFLVLPRAPRAAAAAPIDKDEIGLLEKELIRFEEFAKLAINGLEAVNQIFEIKASLGLFGLRR